MAIETGGELNLETQVLPYVIPYNTMDAHRAIRVLIYCIHHRHSFEVIRSEDLDDPRYYLGVDEAGVECLRKVGIVE